MGDSVDRSMVPAASSLVIWRPWTWLPSLYGLVVSTYQRMVDIIKSLWMITKNNSHGLEDRE